MRLIVIAALGLAGLSLATQAAAQGPLCSNGKITRVRVSKIKAGSDRAAFDAAVAAHIAWFQKRGLKIDQKVAPVLIWDPAARAPKASPDEVMTFATGDEVPRETRDAEWTAYVAKYRAASDLVAEHVICMPN